MKELKIVLSADWHLDSPWELLNGVQASEMRRLQREIPHRIARIAREEQADLILLPGDLFDSGKPYLDSARELESAFAGLDIPVFIAPGNHDHFGKNSPWDSIDLPDNVYVFRSDALRRVSTPHANIYGAAFTSPHREGMELRCAPERGKYDILLLHGDVGGRSEYLPISERQLAESGFHFAALGHIHRPSGLKKAGNTWWCYPGCPMGRGFDEPGPRGAMLINLSENGCSAEFLELSDRRYAVIEADATGREPYEALAEAVNSARPGDICRFVLTGTADRPIPRRSLDALAKSRGLYAAFLLDRTVPPAEQGENTLRGTVIRLAHERMAAAPGEREEIAAALKWALAALDGAEAPEEAAQ